MLLLRPLPGKLLCLLLLCLTACTPRGKVTCPSFNADRTSATLGIKLDFSFPEWRQKRFPQHKKSRQGPVLSSTVIKQVELKLSGSNDHASEKALLAVSSRSISAASGKVLTLNCMAPKKQRVAVHSSSEFRKQKISKQKKIHALMKATPIANKEKMENPVKKERKTAITIGGGLILMAVLSGIAIPVLGTVTASIGLVGIFLLDILVSIAIIRYHKKYQPRLARATGILRLVYTAVFGVGIGHHLAGNVALFNKYWGIGLIVFGLHLIALGVLFHNEGGKKWVNVLIKSLLIVAGIGYIVQQVGVLLVANPVAYAALIQSIFIAPMILGEVLYALWLLIKGGRSKANVMDTSG